jgi:hypothetical protein
LPQIGVHDGELRGLALSHPDSGRYGCALVLFSSIRHADQGAVECMLSFPVAPVVSAELVIPEGVHSDKSGV